MIPDDDQGMTAEGPSDASEDNVAAKQGGQAIDSTAELFFTLGEDLDAGPVDGKMVKFLDFSAYHGIYPAEDSFYGMLGIDPASSFAEVDQSFYRTVRSMLQRQFVLKSEAIDARDFRPLLKKLCVARDVLRDPATRADYDLRLLGVREPLVGQKMIIPEEAVCYAEGGSVRISLGELLSVSSFFEGTALTRVWTISQTMPEENFYEFLASAGVLTETEVKALLQARDLFCAGIISLLQVRTALYMVRNNNADFAEVLLHYGWAPTPSACCT